MTASISIVVRTKNRPEYLSRAVQSITSQTFGEWQAVIVNDGGDPEPVDAILEALAPDLRDRFTVIHSPSSRGRWASANAGVLATQAPLLVLHDDDDTWSPEFLELANEYMQQHPERDAVVSRIEIVWEERAGDEFEVIRSEIFQPQLHDLLLSDALLFNRFVPIGFVYRRRLHEELGLFREALPVIGDWDFNLKVLARGPLEFLGPVPLVQWRQRESSSGDDGNSVIEASDDHEKYDALLRDEQLRAYVAENGPGLVLYLTKFIDRRLVEVENGIRAEIVRASPLRQLKNRARRRFPRFGKRDAEDE